MMISLKIAFGSILTENCVGYECNNDKGGNECEYGGVRRLK